MRVLPGACQESSTSQSRRCESRVGVALARAPQPCRTTATLEAQVPVNSRSVVDPSMPTQAAQEGPHHRVSSQQAIRPDVGSTSSIEMTVCGCRRGRIRANPDLRRFATRATANSTSLSLLRVGCPTVRLTAASAAIPVRRDAVVSIRVLRSPPEHPPRLGTFTWPPAGTRNWPWTETSVVG